MKQQEFERQHQALWEKLSELLHSEDTEADARQLPSYYKAVSHHLAVAKQRHYSTNLIHRLNQLVIGGHRKLYRDLPRYKASFLYYLFVGFPRVIRKNAPFVWTALGLFYIPGLVFFFLCMSSDDLIYSLMSHEQVKDFEGMYDPVERSSWSERKSDTDLQMFGFYIFHNIKISFQTFASGLFWGLGSLFYIIYNGIYIGAVSGHIVQVGFQDTFFTFVIGHGAFELTAIVFSGAAGLKLGWALIAPAQTTRLAALKIAAKEAVVIVYGTTVMLVLAAFIEAFWSSTTLHMAVKYGVGAVFWLITLLYFLLAGRSHAT